jgi:hypothetical protein
MASLKNLLTFNEVKNGIDSYYKSIPESRKASQTQSIWFSLTDIKDFLTYIEKVANEKQIPISGLRFHLITNETESDQTNIALCPTVEIKNSKDELGNHSFDPNYSEKGSPALLVKLMNDDEYADKTSSVLNRGQMCPILCPEII